MKSAASAFIVLSHWVEKEKDKPPTEQSHFFLLGDSEFFEDWHSSSAHFMHFDLGQLWPWEFDYIKNSLTYVSSSSFSHQMVSNSLWYHRLQRARLPWDPQASLTTSQSLPKFTSTESVMPSNHLILCHPSLLLPSIFPSLRVFSSESTFCIKWPKYWKFSFSISPNSEYSGLISFKINRLIIKWVKVTQSCLTLCDALDYTVHGILQARILEWVAFPFSRGSSQPRDQTQVSHIAGRFFTSWATREAQEYWSG